MNRLLVATRNRGKQAEFRRLLLPLDREICFPDDLGLVEMPDEDRLEVHASFEANARAKAEWFRDRAGLDTLADDSGLEVDALFGAPGVHSKRFAGDVGPEESVAERNIAELLQRLRGVPARGRSARFRCVLVLSRAGGAGQEIVAEGSVEGRILDAPDGASGFGYDPVFWSTELGRAFGSASAETKGSVSHRGRAVASLVEALRG
ncbi:MAG TPA: non-canonical purine NTP pyrophosphatase [Gemmatimonadales bacterium]|nr:non-canonical purine NTP pyrophosphatase [Gemmatimonadales bacterium]